MTRFRTTAIAAAGLNVVRYAVGVWPKCVRKLVVNVA